MHRTRLDLPLPLAAPSGTPPERDDRRAGVGLRPVIAILLLVLGVQGWLTLGKADWGQDHQVLLVLAALAVSLIPAVRRVIAASLDRVRHPSPRGRRITAVVLGLAVAGYCLGTVWAQGRPLVLYEHDEHMYMVHAQILARGRLWMPQHELADFFETFHIFVKPVYASMHFPGTAMLYAIGVWLHLPFWAMALAPAGAVAALLYRVVGELVDGVAGVVAALWLVSLPMFRAMALVPRSQLPLLMFVLLMTWAWLRWRSSPPSRAPAWALLIGVFAGWAAICRPLEALVYALPIAAGVAWELRRAPGRSWARAVLPGLAGVVPFLAIQVVNNVGVTGDPLKTPHQQYVEVEYPRATFGLRRVASGAPDADTDAPARQPASSLPQKRQYYQELILPAVLEHDPANALHTWGEFRAYATLKNAAHPLAMVLMPLGLLALTDVRRWATFLALPLFIVGFTFSTFYLDEYTMGAIPPVALLTLLGVKGLGRAWPRAARGLTTGATAALVVLLVTALPEFNRRARHQWFPPTGALALRDATDRLVRRPAVVLITSRPSDSIYYEPVYNVDVAWPDDATVVRAHDLGPERNRELFAYYARHQPDRHVYRWDRATGVMHELGPVTDLAR